MNGLLTSSLLSPAPIEKTFTPTATRTSLMAFVADGETAATLEGCLSQLSIRDATIKSGGIAKAIRHLGAERSPENIIVDISLTDMPVSRVQDLAQLCEPGVAVIAIGDRNDIGLYRDLVQAGVSDYVVKPITPQLLANALSPRPASADRIIPVSRKLGKMVAFVGARGGVGTTTLAINLAWYLADRQKRRVLLLDLDLQNGDCALALNVSPTPGLCDALANPQRIDSVFLERTMAAHSERLFVLSAEEALSADVDFRAEAIETLVGVLRTQFHYVIVDVPRLPGAPYRRSLDMADIRIIVADQTLLSVRDTVRLQAALGRGNAAHRTLIVANRSGEGGRYVMTLEEMAKVDLRPNIEIPFRPKVFTAAGLARHSRFTKAVAALAEEISGHMPERTPWWRSVRW
jgi:pilus assembly protein CpaE